MRPVVSALAALLILAASGAMAQQAPAPGATAGAPDAAGIPEIFDPNGLFSPPETAEQLSESVLGPRRVPDYAYGAYQRGLYLTALEIALDRAGGDNKDAAAQTLIGFIYANGLGVAENDSLAASWYNIAARNGDANAAFELALMLENGTGVPENKQRAAELFTQAANADYPEAQYNLALLYVQGSVVEPNLTKAAGLMKKAADAGLPQALYDYGTMLMDGTGIAPDTGEGAYQIGLAAKAGLSEAQVEYATLLYLGQGVKQNRSEAARWYEKAANAGNPVAQNRLAKLYAVGEEVPADPETAAMWRALARRQGLNDPSLDRLLVSIPDAQLRQGEERARYWPGLPPTQSEARSFTNANSGDATDKAVEQAVEQALDGQTTRDHEVAPDQAPPAGNAPAPASSD